MQYLDKDVLSKVLSLHIITDTHGYITVDFVEIGLIYLSESLSIILLSSLDEAGLILQLIAPYSLTPSNIYNDKILERIGR